MAFKRKADVGQGEVFKFEKIGQQITGFYLGSFDHAGNYGPTKKHVFKTPKGVKVVFGQGHLTQLLEGEAPGQLMQITYAGDKKLKKGNPMKEYTLDIDADQTLDADEIPGELEASSEPEEYESPESDEPTEVEEEEEEMDTVKTAPARSLAAPKAQPAVTKSRVNEILAQRAKKA